MLAIDLSGKTALVTGSATGLGAETARFLARAGAAVVVNYQKNASGAEAVVASVRGEGGRAIAAQGDVSNPDAVAAMFAQARAQLGPVTIVVNNAGREERLGEPFELGWDDYQVMIDMNLKAVYNTVRNAHEDMKSAGWGRVVNIGSIALNRPFPGSAAYVSGKGAMHGITRALASELGPVGITVNMIAPGWIPVERHAAASTEALERLARETPLRRIGVPADIAGAVLFFCSDLAAFVTGQYLPVSGGEKV